MPRDPDEAPQRNVDIDDEQRWRLRLREIVEMESKYNQAGKSAVYLSWRFSVHDLTVGTAVLTNSGDVFELWVASSDSTFFDPDQPDKIGGAREMAHVLMGRPVANDEVRRWNASGIEGWNDALVGKTLIADLEWTTDAKGYERLKLLRKRPDKDAPRQEPAPAPAPPPVPSNGSAETPEERRARLRRELAELDA